MSQASLFDAEASKAQPFTSLESQFDALPADWRKHLKTFIDSPHYAPLCAFVDAERAAGKTVYPADVFRSVRASAYSSCVCGCKNTGKSLPTGL